MLYKYYRKKLKSCNRHNDIFISPSKNLKFKNTHVGERCFILATGPSINKQDLLPLKNEVCIAVSEFYLHKEFTVIHPEYYVSAPNHAPFTDEAVATRISHFINMPSDCNVFIGDNNYSFSFSNYFRRFPTLIRPNFSFIDYSSSEQLSENNVRDQRLWDISRFPFAPRTVVYIAIQVAVYMGFNRIFLLGCDHDYLLDFKRVTNHHFYEESLGISDKEHLSQFSSERWFKEYYYRWMQYRLMNEYLNQRGIQIFNATDGGLLDVFPRVPFESLFI